MKKTKTAILSILISILSFCAFAQNKCLIGVDTFKYIGEYKYDHNYFTEDTVIKANNIKKYFGNISDGKYYFKCDTHYVYLQLQMAFSTISYIIMMVRGLRFTVNI